MLKRLSAVCVLLIVAGCAVTYNPKLVQHIKGSSFKPTSTGYYTAELVMKPEQPAVGMNEAQLIIHNYLARDIPGLDIFVTPRLRDASMESPTIPTVKDAGRGLYLIHNIDFPKAGEWVLDIEINGPDKNDSVTLGIPEVIEVPGGN